MVNKMTNLDKVTQRCNPTRCANLNGLIGSMIKVEVAGRGQPSHARRVQNLAADVLGNTGTHSLRKFAAVTYVRMPGFSKDKVDVRVRGRWKSSTRIQDTYADTTIPCIDGKVAAALCKGGPIAYVAKESSGVTDDWIRTHVLPRTAKVYPKQIATARAKFGKLSRTVTRLAASPAFRLVCNVPVAEEEVEELSSRIRALLMSRPKTCHDLWQE